MGVGPALSGPARCGRVHALSMLSFLMQFETFGIVEGGTDLVFRTVG